MRLKWLLQHLVKRGYTAVRPSCAAAPRDFPEPGLMPGKPTPGFRQALRTTVVPVSPRHKMQQACDIESVMVDQEEREEQRQILNRVNEGPACQDIAVVAV